MKRRDAFKNLSLFVYGSLTLPATSLLNSCSPSSKKVDWNPKYLNEDEAFFLNEISNTIIPNTEFPGALAVGVPKEIEDYVFNVFENDKIENFRNELNQLDDHLNNSDTEKSFYKSSLKERGILPGDVVLINTGWSDNYQDPDELGLYYSKAPGVSYNLVKYLADKQVVGVGLDTWGVDTFADEDEYGPERSQNPVGIANPAHHYFLTKAGIHTLENFNLKGLAKDNVELSCIMILPLMTEGSSASPIRPVAIGI